jgi:acyl carrier protein
VVLKTVEHFSNTEDRVIEKIAYELNIPIALLNPYTDFVDDLYLDKIDRSLLIAKLERDFNVILSKEEVARIQTVRDTAQLIHLYAAS